jgi:hypothetical protein
MHTAPAVTYPLAPSRFYRVTVIFLAIILIAAHALFYWPDSIFSLKSWWAGACTVMVIGWAGCDAFKPVQGDLRFADGQWVLAQNGLEKQGTLQPHIDLQTYMLVRFSELKSSKTTWLHLERHTVPKITKKTNQADIYTGPGTQDVAWLWAHHWMDVRRAVYSRSQPLATHEQPTL